MKQLLILVLLLTVFVSLVGAAATGSFDAKLSLVNEAGLKDELAALAIKGERPMAAAAFAETHYRFIRGPGRAPGSDWGGDGAAAVWLAVLDDEYRATANLIFVKGNDVPGVPDDRWISLTVFEKEIMPEIAAADKRLRADAAAKRKVDVVVARATALHRLSWNQLLVVPGERGEGWRPLAEKDGAWAELETLKGAYGKRDAAAMRTAASAMVVKLGSLAGAPAQGRLQLEVLFNHAKPLWVGFLFYVAASLLLFVWAALKKRWLSDAAAWVALAGFVLITAGMVARSIIALHLPVTGMYEYLVLFAWAAVLFFLLFYAKTRNGVLGLITLPASFILLVLASLFPSDIEGQLIPALQSWWLNIHVLLAVLGEGAFAVGFGVAVIRLFRSDKPGAALPSAEKLEILEYRAIAIGYPLFTVGALVAGAIWAQIAWSAWWSWDPKETAALAVFLIATAYLHARRTRGWRGRKASLLAVFIFLASVFTLFANLIFGGLHSYGQ